MRIPELGVTATRRSLALLAATLVSVGCTAPAAVERQAPSDTPAVTASPSAAPTAMPTPSATVEPSDTPAPTLAFDAPDDILPPNSIVVVVVDALQLRGGPGLSHPVVGSAPAGETFFVVNVFAPFVADGLDWYRLSTAGDSVLWAAAGSGADRYLEVVPPTCPSGDPDTATLMNMNEWDRLACFGDRRLTLEGTYGCEGCGGMWVGEYEPQWLAYPITAHPLQVTNGIGGLSMHMAPESSLDLPAQGSIVRVTGHFSDPASATCRITTGDPIEVNPTTAELHCREQFVVDSLVVLGIDPNFPSP